MDNNMSLKRKKQYIKRHIDNDILCIETANAIYKVIIESNNKQSIRNGNTNNCGTFIDLDLINESTIDVIFGIVKKRLDNISM